MNRILKNLRLNWRYMFTVPWHPPHRIRTLWEELKAFEARKESVEARIHSEPEYDEAIAPATNLMVRVFDLLMHWLYWTLGWVWSFCGLIGGALVAPSVVQWIGLTKSPYQQWFEIGVAIVGGLLVQLFGWVLLSLYNIQSRTFSGVSNTSWLDNLGKMGCVIQLGMFIGMVALNSVSMLVAVLLPIVSVGYGIYRYITWIGPDQRSVAIAFLGGLLIKTIALHLLIRIVTSKLFKRFKDWLSGAQITPPPIST